jgi:hypothetical protein
MATDQNLIDALNAVVAKAETAANSSTPEELVYLGKALEAVGPASTTRFIVEIGESERARVIAEGNTAVSNLNSVLATAGSKGGIKGVTVFRSNGTWTKPDTSVKRIRVQLVGGGGGSAGHDENGGAGGYSEKFIDVESISSISVTVGGGGSKANWGSNAGGGGSSSFGSYLSAGGGMGGHHSSHKGGVGGEGSGGDINIRGGGGCGHSSNSTQGAASYFGGGSPGAHHNAGDWYASGSHGAPGAGGAGQYTSHNNRNVTGAVGMVIVWEYGQQ